MTNPFADEDKRAAFLATPRLAILISHRLQPAPIGVPLWFEWNGTTVEMFAEANSPKVGRLRRDPNASVLVVNSMGEREGWLAFDGTIEIHPGGIELARRMAERYWDLSNPTYRKVLQSWEAHAEGLCQLSLTPNRIRSGSG